MGSFCGNITLYYLREFSSVVFFPSLRFSNYLELVELCFPLLCKCCVSQESKEQHNWESPTYSDQFTKHG